MTLVSLGMSPSLYAAATQARQLPVSLAALYEKINPKFLLSYSHHAAASPREC